jgi:hypothetical protein
MGKRAWQNDCRSSVEELFDAAVKNLSAFEPFLKPEGLVDGLGWAFIDWGYARPEGPIDPALNFHYLAALRSMIAWCQRLKRPEDHFARLHEQLTQTLKRYIAERSWDKLGYHVASLSLAAGMLDEKQTPVAIEFIRKHILDCFPNNLDAPRLSSRTPVHHADAQRELARGSSLLRRGRGLPS